MITPYCPKHNELMFLNFYVRPGSAPGNGWACKSCIAARTPLQTGQEPQGQAQWVLIADGEGADCKLVYGNLEQALHDFMCVCKNPWKECSTEGIREDIQKLDDPDEWCLNDERENFSFHLEHECGKISVYRLRATPSQTPAPAQGHKSVSLDLSSYQGDDKLPTDSASAPLESPKFPGLEQTTVTFTTAPTGAAMERHNLRCRCNRCQVNEVNGWLPTRAAMEPPSDSYELEYNRVMGLLRNTKMPHGLCEPRDRKACTHCNAVEQLDELIANYKGARVRAAAPRSEAPPAGALTPFGEEQMLKQGKRITYWCCTADFGEHEETCPNFAARSEPGAQPLRVEQALRAILEIGKRDMSNPKYDGYFNEARAALAATPEPAANRPNEVPHEYPHRVVCNGDRRYPAGVPGHSCSCLNWPTQGYPCVCGGAPAHTADCQFYGGAANRGGEPQFEPLLTNLTHTRSCPALIPGEDDCTCGLEWRIRLRTEMEMHNAWRKKAEECEWREAKVLEIIRAGYCNDTCSSQLGNHPCDCWKAKIMLVTEAKQDAPPRCEGQDYVDTYNRGFADGRDSIGSERYAEGYKAALARSEPPPDEMPENDMAPMNSAYYDKSDPTVQALERGFDRWYDAGCHETGCGCVTVYIYEELMKLARSEPGAQPLRELVEKWRKNGDATRWKRFVDKPEGQPSPAGASMLTCADELETALRSEPGAQPLREALIEVLELGCWEPLYNTEDWKCRWCKSIKADGPINAPHEEGCAYMLARAALAATSSQGLKIEESDNISCQESKEKNNGK